MSADVTDADRTEALFRLLQMHARVRLRSRLLEEIAEWCDANVAGEGYEAVIEAGYGYARSTVQDLVDAIEEAGDEFPQREHLDWLRSWIRQYDGESSPMPEPLPEDGPIGVEIER